MGKGDKKSKKGKIFMGSYGVSRPHNKKKVTKSASPAKLEKKAERAEKAELKAAAPKKAAKKVTKKEDTGTKAKAAE
jgi:30S ribosomal protein S31